MIDERDGEAEREGRIKLGRTVMIVPTLRVGMQPGTLRVPKRRDAERHRRHSHAERGNDHEEGLADSHQAGVTTRRSSVNAQRPLDHQALQRCLLYTSPSPRDS